MSSILKGKPADAVYTVQVDVGGAQETVTVHPEKGPLIRNYDGSTTNFIYSANPLWNRWGASGQPKKNKTWSDMKPTEQEICLHTVAKKNAKLREWEQACGGKVDPQIPEFLVPVLRELESRKMEEKLALKQDSMHSITNTS
mmetsp:Transcript_32698/g.76014  ORF Transcript_32698/g.76014 Transcript_32698/m.76014 type:complete len:142 (-) Transcript_32698:53-478(-)